MKRKTAIIIFIILLIVCVILTIFVTIYFNFVKQQNSYNLNETFTVANWNLQIFGDKKANNTELMNRVAEIISKHDIIFIQEIRDKDADSFWKLCSMLPDYHCNISSRAGRSSSKEQYGILYYNNIKLINITDYNPDILDRWERPPIKAEFLVENYSFSIYTIHTKPNETVEEISYLEDVVETNGNVIILGDLNADCNYYPRRRDFLEWHWIIADDEDTTATNSDCAYDRIIMNDDAYNEEVDYGIYEKTDTSISDHYLVWTRIRIYEYDKDTRFSNWLKI